MRVVTELVDIFDREAFEQEVRRLESPAARADTIAHRLQRTVTERMEQDPAFYLKFSELIDETIKAYLEGRIDELEYLEIVMDAMEQVLAGHDRSQPHKLRRYRHAPAYHGMIHETLAEYSFAGDEETQNETIADIAIHPEELIEARKIRDWADNQDVQNTMWNDIEDYLYSLDDELEIAVSAADMDYIIGNVIDVARKRDNL